MNDILQYPTYKTFTCEVDNRQFVSIPQNIVTSWMTYGKLPQTVFFNPTYRDMTVVADGANRYLSSVTVNAIPVTNMTVTLAVGATLTIGNAQAVTAVSTSEATATATIASKTITITGVAAGTTTVAVTDINNDIIYTIDVTVA
jgi:hypothetical protein